MERTPSDSLEQLVHEKCDKSAGTLVAVDSNGDGKLDVFTVTDGGGGRPLCRYADLNRDGRVDLYEFFDSTGEIRRREFVYGDATEVDALEFYSGGRLVRRLYDTTGRHRVDTWDWFDPNVPLNPSTGRPVHPSRRERDSKGIGQVDQWWTWAGDVITVVSDRNGDGRPDPGTTVVLGATERKEGATSPGVADGGSSGGDAMKTGEGGAIAIDASLLDAGVTPAEASAP
jgi:hypothetical protein